MAALATCLIYVCAQKSTHTTFNGSHSHPLQESKVTKAALEEQISELQGQVTKLEAAHAAELKQQQETAAAELQALQERLTCEEQAHTSSTQEVVQLQEQLEEVRLTVQ